MSSARPNKVKSKKEHAQRAASQPSKPLTMSKMLTMLEPVYRELSENTPVYSQTICIEGNIGSGKSTLIKSLEGSGYEVHPEPVRERWGQFLPILYNDPARWGMCFQMEVLDWFHSLKEEFKSKHAGISAHDDQSAGGGKKLIIVERSPQSAFEIFTVNLHDCGLLTDWEKSLLLRFYHLTRWRPAKLFYLRTPPAICCERIRQRSRTGEEQVDEELLKSLHQKHEELFMGPENELKVPENVVVIDGTDDRAVVQQKLLEELEKFQSSLDADSRDEF